MTTSPEPLAERMRRHYADAIQVQNACNLSGVVHSLSRMLPDIRDEVNAAGGGTEEVNRHPIVTLFIEKLVSLNGRWVDGAGQFCEALHTCEERAKA